MAAPARDAAEEFTRSIRPVLAENCFECHGDQDAEGDLKVLDYDQLVKGRFVVPGNPEKSVLWDVLANNEMPPKGQPRLTESEKEMIRNWIALQE